MRNRKQRYTSSMSGRLTMHQKEAITGYAFISMNLLGTFIFILLPLLMTAVLSFMDYDFINGFRSSAFNGLDNYKRMFSDPRVLAGLKNNLFFTCTQIPISIVLSLLLASVLNRFVHMKTFLRTIYFIPFITSWTMVSLIFKAMFEPTGGPVNTVLRALGVENPPGWFVDIDWVMFSIVIMTVWRMMGYYTIIFLSGMQNVSEELYDSAKIDGAGPRQRYFHITLPLITPQIFFVSIVAIIGSLKVFDQVSVATQGGPGTASAVLVFNIYEYAFTYYEFGYSSAIAQVLFLVILIITIVQWKLQDKWVHYTA